MCELPPADLIRDDVERRITELRRMKRVLFWGCKNFLVEIGKRISPKTCNISYATQTDIVLDLVQRGAVDLICTDHHSVHWGEIERVRKAIGLGLAVGAVALRDVRLTDKQSTQKLLAELKGE